MATMSTNTFQPEIETLEHSRVKWGSIIAGVLLAMAVQVALALFGLAIGLSSLNPATNTNFSGIGIGTSIWLFVSVLISLFLGSIVASWFGATHHRDSSILHGVLVWGLFLLISVSMLSSSVKTIAGGVFNLASAGIAGVSQGAAMATATHGPNAIQQQTGSVVTNPNVQQTVAGTAEKVGPASHMLANLSMPAKARAELTQKMAMGDDAGAAQIVRQNSTMSQTQAMDLVRTAREENIAAVRNTAQKVTDTAGKAAWVAFFAVVLSLIVSALGGLVGGKLANALTGGSYQYIER